LAAWSFCVTSPIWLVLLFALMQANDMPTWAWVLYWVYVPCQMVAILSRAVARQLLS
jgi:hypothetical protein